jgi:hypothetical protein
MVLWRCCGSLVVGWGLRTAISPITALLQRIAMTLTRMHTTGPRLLAATMP